MKRIGAVMMVGGAVGVVAGGLLSARPASADPTWLNAFLGAYPESTLLSRTLAATGDRCLTCHDPAGFDADGNCYRDAIRASLMANPAFTQEQHLRAIEMLDSDGDGVVNVDEILRPRPDGVHVGYNPGLAGDLGKDPCGPDPSVAVTGESETPPPLPACPCEFDGDAAQVNVFDLLAYLNLWFAADAGADIDGAAGVDVFDLLFFLDCWFAASAGNPCP